MTCIHSLSQARLVLLSQLFKGKSIKYTTQQHRLNVDMASESKLHIYTQQSKINGFSQFLARKE